MFGETSGGSSASASEILFRSPFNGSRVSGDVTIQATVSDSDGLAVLEWLVDGTSVYVTPVGGKSSGVSFVWHTADADPGRHIVSIIVTDARGQQTTGSLNLTVR